MPARTRAIAFIGRGTGHVAAALADDTERLRRRSLGGVADHGQMRFHAGHRDARPAAHPGRIIT